MGETADGFYFSLGGGDISFPGLDYLVHCGWWGGEVFLFAVVVEGCVVECEQGVLDIDLCSQEVGEDGKCGGDQRRKMGAEMVVCRVIFLL